MSVISNPSCSYMDHVKRYTDFTSTWINEFHATRSTMGHYYIWEEMVLQVRREWQTLFLSVSVHRMSIMLANKFSSYIKCITSESQILFTYILIVNLLLMNN